MTGVTITILLYTAHAKLYGCVPTDLHGNYLEVVALASVDQGHSLSPHGSLPGISTFLSVADVQRHMK